MPVDERPPPQLYSPKRDAGGRPAPQYNYNQPPPQRDPYPLNYPPAAYALRESYSVPDAAYPLGGRQGGGGGGGVPPGSPRLPVPRSAEMPRRYVQPAYPSPPPIHRVPLRQDVLPPPQSPTLRPAPRYEQVMARGGGGAAGGAAGAGGGYRTASPDHYGAYGEAGTHPQDPRQKNSLIGAV